MFKKTDKPPIPLLSPVRSTLRDTLSWSWTEVEPRDKNVKSVCVDSLMKSEDWSPEGDQRWRVGGWLSSSFLLTIVFPGRQPPNRPHCFLAFRLSGVGGWRVCNILAPANCLNHPTLSEKNNIRGHANFWLKRYIFSLSFISLFKAKQLFFSILQTNPTISRTIFFHHRPHCHHDSLPGITFTSHFHSWF